MARTQRLIRLATGVAFLLLLLANGQANADTNAGGVIVAIWNNQGWNASPPFPTTEPTGELIDADIWHDFDQQPLFNLYEDFIVRFQSNITSDVDAQIRFYAPADDGVKMYLSDVNIIDDWIDKGGGGSFSEPVQFTAGMSQPVTLWFYENGGGAWVELWWQINDGDWQPVPASAFSLSPATPPTTEPTTTTDAPTTTQQPSTTTTSIETQTTLNLQTTIPVTVPETTTTSVAVTTVPSTVPVATSLAPAPTYAPTTTQPMPTTTLPIPETTSTILSTTTTLQLVEDTPINAEEAAALATDPEVLAEATPEEAQQIFEALELDTLTDTELDALVEAVQDAPAEVRAAFEESINIFDGAVDSYVPLGSTVPISTRRLVIAAGAMLAAAPVPSARRK